jgi:cytochrome d ubiquinol oxidase subunit I
MLRLLIFSALCPQLANQAGWVSAEMGRYPWIVQNLLRISDGLSKAVTANQVLGSLVMFTFLYFLLFLVFIYLLNEKFKYGPSSEAHIGTPYHHLKIVATELKKELSDDTPQ